MKDKTNFEKAVELSLNKWVESLDADKPLPEPSEKYKKAMKEILSKKNS